ncbi:MAG: carbon-monoxide dehydrogenase catalytic subunit [Candidatus Methanoperedenaceae archaeon HGW-Methanoperedenaceae-1]|nr:MAG: carbon-monoxide dehydrogenase catalytic subunit [Candidatus Methanoperedenaceae archaeon HGW-Methanoperedenaceae-1]
MVSMEKNKPVLENEPNGITQWAEKKEEGMWISDPETMEMIQHAQSIGIDTVFHRQSNHGGFSLCNDKSRCYFGSSGLCCRQCAMGPCRLRQEDLNKSYKINKGTCGANSDTITSRNLLMMIARGTAAHASHARHLASALRKISEDKSPYTIKEPDKLKAIAAKLNSGVSGSIKEYAKEVSSIALSDIIGSYDYMRFATSYCPLGEKYIKMDVIPMSVGLEMLEQAHETSMGTMSDPTSMLLHASRLGLADIASLMISSEIADVIFGIPKPISSKIGFNVLEKDKVNVVMHGHVQLLSEWIVELSEEEEFINKAKKLGASGINVVGCCCTGNEVLMRHGVPLVGSNLQQELIITTGLVEAFIVDVQCIYPNLENVADKFHTRLISTMKEGRFANAEHIPFDDEHPDEIARKILDIAIENFPNRNKKTFLPSIEPRDMIAGFSVESCIDLLSKLNKENPIQVLLDQIASGNIYGIVLLAGCTSPKVSDNSCHATIAKKMMEHNVLVVATGCAAQACARAGLLTGEATGKYAGSKLKDVLRILGETSGMDTPLPPIWHFGSCADNARVINLALALADALGVGIKDLPVGVSATEWITEKAAAIGFGGVALGFTVHLGITPPFLGSDVVASALTDESKSLFGGKFVVENDPVKASEYLLNLIKDKREKLGLAV